MLAHVHDRMSAQVVSEPEIEGEIVVRRHEVGRMVSLCRIDVIASCRLDADNDVAEAMDRQGKASVCDEGITLRCAPAVGDALFHVPRQRVEVG